MDDMKNGKTLLDFSDYKENEPKNDVNQEAEPIIETKLDATEKNEKTKNQMQKKERVINAEELGKKQREISIAEFFEKNRHLLGFDNKRKALLTSVKEAVDNSLDACEDARILPEIIVEIIQMDEERYRVIVEDNGPGIVKEQVPKIFGKLLYGSRFHSMKQSRGQQGIGISAVALYSQLTTGRPIKVQSRTSPNSKAHYFEISIDILKNAPLINKYEEIEWKKERGTRIEVDIEGNYYRGAQSVDEYLKQTAIVNPHATIIYLSPKGDQQIFARATEELPKEAREIKPHPHGVELGVFLRMISSIPAKTIHSFLTSSFSRVSANVASQILDSAGIDPKKKPSSLSRAECITLYNIIQKTKFMAPPTDCLSPIGKEEFEKGLRKEVNAEFYDVVSRPASVYRGNPFKIEAGIAYGGKLSSEDPATILRFANRVPLLYQAGACVFTKAVIATNWKAYGLNQPKGSLPVGPIVIALHIASVWTPYTSEAKEAIASYPEILKEVKLALQDLGRSLKTYINKKTKTKIEVKKRSYISRFIPHIADSIAKIIEETDAKELEEKLSFILEERRGKLDNFEFDEKANKYFDDNFAITRGTGLLEDSLEEEKTNDDEESSEEMKN
ncbi:MAG: topoisomerase subunit [Candidatus Woesearchaeota archaeon]|nr:topoisomerase subunit [Candidatus Woesearchaeota archaeon]